MSTDESTMDKLEKAKRHIAQLSDEASRPEDPGFMWERGVRVTWSNWLAMRFRDELELLAKAGRWEDIKDFWHRIPWEDTLGNANKMEAPWVAMIFEKAHPSILSEMLVGWAEPVMLRPSGKSFHCSPTWGACVGVAIARAEGDEEILSICMSLMEKALDPEGCAAREEMSKILGHAIARARPGSEGGFERALSTAVKLLGDSRIPSGEGFLPMFASRLQSEFDDAYDAVLAGEGSLEGWSLCAQVFLRWVVSIDLEESTFYKNVRAINLCLPFALEPALAPEVAAVCAPYAGPEGFTFSEQELESSHSLGLPYHGSRSLFVDIGWVGRPVGPVDLALLLGSLESARALLNEGVAWSPTGFEEMAERLRTHPTIENDFVETPYKRLPVREACMRAMALAQRLVLEDASAANTQRDRSLRM